MSFLRFISKEMQRPTNYGWFHLLFLGLVIGFAVLICMLYKNCREKTFRRIILIGWILIFLFELYKQIVFSYSESNNLAVWDYQWYAFPYQMCSSTLYLLPIVIFVKDCKLRDAVISYLSIFVLFAGICVMIYPNDVFVNMIGINLQTMIHHGLQVIFGVFFIVYNRRKWNLKYFLLSLIVLGVMIASALLLNLIVPIFVKNETFNMFYISPYFDCTLPILSGIYSKVPYLVFLLIYTIGFALAGLLVFGVAYYIINFAKVNTFIKDKFYQIKVKIQKSKRNE